MTLISNEWAALCWAQLWQVTMLAIAVAATVRLVFRNRPRMAYLLWLIVIAKAATPPLWSCPTGIFSWVPFAPISTASSPHDDLVATPATATSEVSVDVDVSRIEKRESNIVSEFTAAGTKHVKTIRLPFADRVFAAWFGGLCLFGVVVLVKSIRLRFYLKSNCKTAEPSLQNYVNNLASRLAVRQHVSLRITDTVGPAVFGCCRPIILIPEALLNAKSVKELEPVIVHELAHVRRGDMLVGRLQLLVQLVWWFHPMVWWANREVRRERERCVDEEVVSGFRCQPSIYARILLDTEDILGPRRQEFASAGTHLSNVNFERLEEIMNRSHLFSKRTPIQYWLLAATVALLVLPGKSLTTSAFAGDKNNADSGRLNTSLEVGQNVTPIRVLSVERNKLSEQTIPGSGDGPSIICFISRTTEDTLDLIRTMDHYASKQQGLSRHYVFLSTAFRTDDRGDIVKALRSSFPKLPPSISLDKRPEDYGVSPDAGLTVLITSEGRVASRFAFSDVSLLRDGEQVFKALSGQLNKTLPSFAINFEQYRKERRAWYEREAKRSGRFGEEKMEGPGPDGDKVGESQT